MVNNEFLIECIENEEESSIFDFKKDIYDFSNSKNKQDFLTDVLSFANGHSNSDKYIITGVKLYKDKPRDLVGITKSKIKDGADYQSLINDNIEPNIIVDFKIIEYDEKKYGVFRINNENIDRPYLLKKNYEKLCKGFIKIRKGQKNEFISRRDLDLFYENKIKIEISNIIVKGIISNKISKNFSSQKYIFNIDYEKIEQTLRDMFIKLSNFKLIKSESNSLCFGSPVEISQDDFKNIIKYSTIYEYPINKDFFDIGGLKYFQMLPSSGDYYGTDSEKDKYSLLYNFEKMTGLYNGYKDYYNKIENLYYIELVIDNIGTKFDEDVEVNLKIEKDMFLEFNSFPIPSEEIINEIIGSDTIDNMLNITKIKGISNYNAKNIHIQPTKPSSYTLPVIFKQIDPSYEEYKEYYIEYINSLADYEIINDEKYFYIKFEQKNIKPNEKIYFPSRLFFKSVPNSISYEIKSKYNSKIISGNIILEEKKL